MLRLVLFACVLASSIQSSSGLGDVHTAVSSVLRIAAVEEQVLGILGEYVAGAEKHVAVIRE